MCKCFEPRRGALIEVFPGAIANFLVRGDCGFRRIELVIGTLELRLQPKPGFAEIDEGVAEGDMGVLVAVSMAYIMSILVHASASFGRIAFTGRLGEKLMYRLRVRVFSHLQRMSVDFFTGEKAGVLMSPSPARLGEMMEKRLAEAKSTAS